MTAPTIRERAIEAAMQAMIGNTFDLVDITTAAAAFDAIIGVLREPSRDMCLAGRKKIVMVHHESITRAEMGFVAMLDEATK